MVGAREAQWTNGKRTVGGRWSYYWPSDAFLIEIDTRDRLTGAATRTLTVKGDRPEWGKFRLMEATA